MEYIRKSIYSLPEIRRILLPLWSAWVLTAVGAVCGIIFLLSVDKTGGGASTLLAGMAVGALALLTLLCYWLFGDSRRPYHRGIHAVLDPTYAYYPSSVERQLVAALEAKDEQALEAVKRQAKPDLVLVRYSDRKESIYYSQLLRIEGKRYIPLTDIIINNRCSDNKVS